MDAAGLDDPVTCRLGDSTSGRHGDEAAAAICDALDLDDADGALDFALATMRRRHCLERATVGDLATTFDQLTIPKASGTFGELREALAA